MHEYPSGIYEYSCYLCRAVLIADVNNDGHDDVIVSAPGFSSPGNYQQGRVYILYGLPFLYITAVIYSCSRSLVGGQGNTNEFFFQCKL